MSKIELFTGQGTVDMVFDLAVGQIETYDGSEEFHARFGGRTYYHSRSGASCAGWVPARPDRVKVWGYRADEFRLSSLIELNRLDSYGRTRAVPALFGHHVLVPYSYADRSVHHEYPVIVVEKSSGQWRVKALLARWELPEYLSGNVRLETRWFDYHVFRSPEDLEPEERSWEISISPGAPTRFFRKVIEAVHYDCLDFQYPEGCWSSKDQGVAQYWSRMGLYPFGDQPDSPVVKITGGIGRARYNRAELKDGSMLQEAAPAVLVLSSGAILTEDRSTDWGPDWRYTYRQPSGHTAAVPDDEVLSLIRGGPEDLAAFLANIGSGGRQAEAVVTLYREGDIDTARALVRASGWTITDEEVRQAGAADALRHASRYAGAVQIWQLSQEHLRLPEVRAAIRLVAERLERESKSIAPVQADSSKEEPLAD